MAEPKPKLIAIVGPTGSGKTALAVALARIGHAEARSAEASRRVTVMPRDSSSRQVGTQDDLLFELVSADSRQVYRGMDIGTGKERVADVPQHLIDIVDPDEEFTLADFLDRAKQVIADIHARGNVPIVVGGTGLYVQALVENWNIPAVAPDKKLRAELEGKSVDVLHHELAVIDPEEAERLGSGKRYLIRALEMWRATGRKPSELKKKNEPLYDILVIGMDLPREELYRRIDARVDGMFVHGLVNEVRGLLKKYPPNLPAFNTIGYKELIRAEECGILEGEGCLSQAEAADRWCIATMRGGRGRSGSAGGEFLSQENFASEPLIDRIKHHTHAYARRQLTWLRRMKYVEWFDDTKNALSRAASFLKN